MTLIRCYNELCIFNKEGICVQIEISINKGCMSELNPVDEKEIVDEWDYEDTLQMEESK